MTGKRRGPKPGTIRAPRVRVVCYECLNEFVTLPGHIAAGGGKFCGTPCYIKYRKGRRKSDMPAEARLA